MEIIEAKADVRPAGALNTGEMPDKPTYLVRRDRILTS